MFTARLPGDAGFQRSTQQLSNTREIEQSIDQRRAVRSGLPGKNPTRGAVKIGRRHQVIYQTDRQRTIATQRFAGEHQLHGLTHTQQAYGANSAAEARMDAQLHFGKAQRQAAVVRRHSVAASQCQLKTAAEREAGNRGDCGAGECGKARKGPLTYADMVEGFGGVAKSCELTDIGAGDKARGLAGAHDQAAWRLGLQFDQGCFEFEQYRLVQRIGRSARPIDGQAGDAIGSSCLQSPRAGIAHEKFLIACESQNHISRDDGRSSGLPGCEMP